MVSSDVLAEAVETYNAYRSPMATATLVRSGAERFVVRFEGPFCRMCCDYDYVEDFVYDLQEFDVTGSSVAIETIRDRGEETYVAEFVVAED